MPDVFLKVTEVCTLTPVPAAGADNHICTEGSAANWGSITSENFLAGPQPGQEQVLIKVGNQTAKVSEGQRWEEVQKKLLLHVYDTGSEDGVYIFDQNRQTTVSKNDTLTVVENQKVTVNENQEVTVGENQTIKVEGELRKVNATNIEEVAVNKILISAGTELILQGPGNGIIKIDSHGITIQGAIVKIN
jgi:hypothetical protein